MLSSLGWVFTDSLNSFPHQQVGYPGRLSRDIIQGTSPKPVLFLLSLRPHYTWSSSNSADDFASHLTEASAMSCLYLTFLNLSLSFYTSSLSSVLAKKRCPPFSFLSSYLEKNKLILVLLNMVILPPAGFCSADYNFSLRVCVTSFPLIFFFTMP